MSDKNGIVMIPDDEALCPVAFESLEGFTDYVSKLVKMNSGGFVVRECLIKYDRRY
jgi:hypothetical protein